MLPSLNKGFIYYYLFIYSVIPALSGSVLTRDHIFFYITRYHVKTKRYGLPLATKTLTMEQGELIIIKLYYNYKIVWFYPLG